MFDSRLSEFDRRRRQGKIQRPVNRVLFHCFTSKYVAFGFVPTGIVYGAPHVVVAFDDFAHFAVLQSGIHDAWVREHTSYLGETPRYTPTDCFETFPFAKSLENLECIGERYYRARAKIMVDRNEGLTKLYNSFHNKSESGAGFTELRELQASLDNAVCLSYGWGDIDLGHDFHSTSKGVRFGICESARLEILDRLLMLNLQLSDKNKAVAKKVLKTSKRERNLSIHSSQLMSDLFSGES